MKNINMILKDTYSVLQYQDFYDFNIDLCTV